MTAALRPPTPLRARRETAVRRARRRAIPSSIFVGGLDTGRTYTCTVTASNRNGAGPASDPSNPFVPIHAGDCTDQTICQANAPALGSAYTPFQTTKVTGTPSAATGSVLLDVRPGTLSCSQHTVPIANLTETGFSPADRLTIVTRLHFATSTTQAQVCFSSAVPFLSQASRNGPKAGTAFLLRCTQTEQRGAVRGVERARRLRHRRHVRRARRGSQVLRRAGQRTSGLALPFLDRQGRNPVLRSAAVERRQGPGLLEGLLREPAQGPLAERQDRNDQSEFRARRGSSTSCSRRPTPSPRPRAHR